jgi:hypothetical protein
MKTVVKKICMFSILDIQMQNRCWILQDAYSRNMFHFIFLKLSAFFSPVCYYRSFDNIKHAFVHLITLLHAFWIY